MPVFDVDGIDETGLGQCPDELGVGLGVEIGAPALAGGAHGGEQRQLRELGRQLAKNVERRRDHRVTSTGPDTGTRAIDPRQQVDAPLEHVDPGAGERAHLRDELPGIGAGQRDDHRRSARVEREGVT